MEPVLINAFEVPAGADDAFIAGWERSRDFLSAQDGYVDAALHRSLSPEADYRFVNVAPFRSVDEWQAAIASPDFPGREMPFAAHPSLYEVVREDPTPADARPRVVLINAFELAARDDERFLAGWERMRSALCEQPGYLGTRLHRSLFAGADFRFVNVAPWQSAADFARALASPGVRMVAGTMPGRAHPSLYEVVRH
jgi:heme oxygenase (mycobilin-producing)